MAYAHFYLPADSTPDHILLNTKPTCVVGLIGRSRIGSSSLVSILNTSITGAQFVSHDPDCGIQCFYDKSMSTLYLYMERYDDLGQLAETRHFLDAQDSHLDYHQELHKLKLKEIKMWLWLFSVCHCVVLFHPSQTFDVSYIRPFRSATQFLAYFKNKIKEKYPDVPLLASSRVYLPKLLFVFQSNSASMHLPPKKGRHGFNNQCKRLALEMETQIFHILRKCRLLPKHHGTGALAYLPAPSDAREPFVFFMDGKGNPSTDHPTAKHVDTALYYISQLSATAPQYTETSEDGMSLNSFIKRNINYLMTQGNLALPEELSEEQVVFAAFNEWYNTAQLLYDFYCNPESHPHFSETVALKICNQLDPEGLYSENRCQKAFPIATSTYMDSLPSHYTKAIHQRQLAHAMQVLSSRAKGPMFDTYATRLQEDCDKVWEDGRKGCESVSLTGNACVLPVHEEQERVHSNRLRMRSACSCGRSISYRSDPFSLETANSEFYTSLAEKCCSSLPQTRTFGRAELSWMISNLSPAASYQTTVGVEQPGFLLGAQYLLPWDLPGEDNTWGANEPKNAWRRRSARCYLGFEYECSKGHRFYCKVGGVPLKCTAATMLKDNLGSNMINTETQLYTNCPSHTSKPLLAQLIRIFVCTPDTVPLSVNLLVTYHNTLINLTVGESVHIPGGKMSVVRLPYVYCDEHNKPLPFDIDAHLGRNPLVPLRNNRPRRNDKKN